MNSQVLIDRVFLQDLLFLIKQPRTKIDARAVLVFGIERALATPATIPDAGEGVEFQSAADEAFRKWEKDGNPIAGVNGYMAARAGFREGAAWHNRIVTALPLAIRAELAEWSPVMQNLSDENQQLRAKLDASKFCANVADDLLAELAEAKETITRYEVTAENCDVLRAELAAIKAQEPVTEVSEETFSSDGTSDVITRNLPIGTKLYAAPVAKQVVMPDPTDAALNAMRRNGLSIDGDNAYKRDLIDTIVGAMAYGFHNTNQPPAGHWCQEFWDIGRSEGELRARLNVADQEGDQDE